MAGVCSTSHFIFAALSALTSSHSCPAELPVVPCASPEMRFSSIRGERAWIHVPPPSPRAGVWASLTLSWPLLLFFSRNLKAALHLLSCWGFSQRLQKPGDLSGMSAQRITLKNCPPRKSCVEGPMVNIFLESSWLWETLQRSQAFQTP